MGDPGGGPRSPDAPDDLPLDALPDVHLGEALLCLLDDEEELLEEGRVAGEDAPGAEDLVDRIEEAGFTEARFRLFGGTIVALHTATAR